MVQLSNRNSYLKRKYGITEQDYEDIFLFQGNRCYICLHKPRKQRLDVDHNHKTGEVRGLLCRKCNHDLLGGAHDSVELLKRALQYLEEPPARIILGDKNGRGREEGHSAHGDSPNG